MPLRSFAIPRVVTEDSASMRAWAYLQQQLEMRHFTPVIADFTGTVPTTNRGFVQLLGPMVFFVIHLKSTSNFGWNANATVSLPFGAYIPTTGEVFPQFAQPVIDVTTALEINTECPAIDSAGLTLKTAQASAGGPTEVAIQGFYLRN